MRRIGAALAGLVVVTALLTACNGPSGGARGAITIAYQPGLGYSPLLITKQQKLLEKKFPDKRFTWKALNSGSAIRDGMLAGQIQIGAGGIGPFIVGHAQGVPWRIVTGLDDADLHLMVKDPKIRKLADLKGKGKIATPGPDSIQAVVLRKAAAEELGDAKAFDSQLVAMGHPDGLQAMESGQIAAHLTSPPFQSQEAESGAHKILGSTDVFGEHTFNGVYAIDAFEKDNREVIDVLREAVAKSVELLNDDPAAAAKILAAEGSAGDSAEKLQKQITADDITFTIKPRGYLEFGTFMKQVGLVDKKPGKASDLFFPSAATKGGT